MTYPVPIVPSVADQVDAAQAWVERRLHVEGLQRANALILQRLGAQGIGVPATDMLSLHLHVLKQHLLGDEDAPRRIEFEEAVQVVLAEKLGELDSQVARAKLLDGVRLDQPKRG